MAVFDKTDSLRALASNSVRPGQAPYETPGLRPDWVLSFTAYAGRRIKFALGKKSPIQVLRTVFLELVSPNSVLLCSFLVLWSGFINPSLHHLVNHLVFLTNIWTALFGKETLKQTPPRLRCSKMLGIRKEKSAEMSCAHFTRLLNLRWHCLKRFLELRILRTSSKNRAFFYSKFDAAAGVTSFDSLNGSRGIVRHTAEESSGKKKSKKKLEPETLLLRLVNRDKQSSLEPRFCRKHWQAIQFQVGFCTVAQRNIYMYTYIYI